MLLDVTHQSLLFLQIREKTSKAQIKPQGNKKALPILAKLDVECQKEGLTFRKIAKEQNFSKGLIRNKFNFNVQSIRRQLVI